MAGLLPYNSKLGQYNGDLNDLHKTAGDGLSIWTITGAATNTPAGDEGVGGLLLNASRYIPSNTLSVVFQIFAGAYSSEDLYYRLVHYNKSTSTETIHQWRKFS